MKVSSRILFLVFSSLILLSSCKKDDDKPATPAPHKYGPLTARDNVVVVDSVSQRLDTSSALLDFGTYRFSGTNGPLNVTVGSVIVGEQGKGFLRKVNSVSFSGNETILQTQHASLDEVFSDGLLVMNISSDSLKEGKQAGLGLNYSVANQNIIQSGGLNMSLTKADLSLNPNWVIKAGFSPDGLVEAEVAARNANLTGSLQLNVTSTQAITLQTRSSLLKRFTSEHKFVVPVVIFGVPVKLPVKIFINWDLELHYGASINQAFSRNVTFTSSNTFDIGMIYANNEWKGIYDYNPVNTMSLGTSTGNANANIKMALVPKMTALLYGEAGPYVSIGLQEELNGNVATPSLDWDFQFDAWLQTIVGATGAVFGEKVPDYKMTWNTDKLTFKTPDHMLRVSGDAQTGPGNQTLPKPIVVRIMDSKGNPQSNVKVYFTPDTGHGSVSASSVFTDNDGYAQTNWTIANLPGITQHLKVNAKKANGQSIKNAPIDFEAVAAPDNCTGTVTDIDGNIYQVVKIGSQCWLAENLKTTKYRNGAPITTGLSKSQWVNTTSGAYTLYDNNPANNATYGKLYNWYAVTDPKGLAPAGWHIPSKAELQTLVNSLGGQQIAGGKLKTTNLWKSPNTGATNSSGFSGLPGGFIYVDGEPEGIGETAVWWATTTVPLRALFALRHDENSLEISENSGGGGNENGFSVRCIKD